jgi:hypothetical protein
LRPFCQRAQIAAALVCRYVQRPWCCGIAGRRIAAIYAAFSFKEETAEPVIKKKTKVGVEYEPDPDLRDTEQVPLLQEGGIEAFFQREVLPHVCAFGSADGTKGTAANAGAWDAHSKITSIALAEASNESMGFLSPSTEYHWFQFTPGRKFSSALTICGTSFSVRETL